MDRNMERLSIIIDNGLDEVHFEVPSDREGAYNILDIAKYSDEEEKQEILLNIAGKLAAYENTGVNIEKIEECFPKLDEYKGKARDIVILEALKKQFGIIRETIKELSDEAITKLSEDSDYPFLANYHLDLDINISELDEAIKFINNRK